VPRPSPAKSNVNVQEIVKDTNVTGSAVLEIVRPVNRCVGKPSPVRTTNVCPDVIVVLAIHVRTQSRFPAPVAPQDPWFRVVGSGPHDRHGAGSHVWPPPTVTTNNALLTPAILRPVLAVNSRVISNLTANTVVRPPVMTISPSDYKRLLNQRDPGRSEVLSLW